MKSMILDRLAEDVCAVVAATNEVAGDQVQEARGRVGLVLEHMRRTYDQICDKAIDGTTGVNEMVHKNTYQAIAVGFGCGAILGCLVAWSSRKIRGTMGKGAE